MENKPSGRITSKISMGKKNVQIKFWNQKEFWNEAQERNIPTYENKTRKHVIEMWQ